MTAKVLLPSTFNLGNDGFTRVLLHFDGADGATSTTDVAKGVTTPSTWTFVGNAQLDTAITKFGTSALLCDGTGDYITAPDSSIFTLGSSDFTIECWFKLAGGSGTTRGMWGQLNSTATAGSIFCQISTGNLIRVATISSGLDVTSSTAFTPVSDWHHMAIVRDGNTGRLYLDGVQEATDTMSGAIDDGATAWTIGRLGDVTNQAMNGSIDEFRMSVGICRYPDGTTFTPQPFQFS